MCRYFSVLLFIVWGGSVSASQSSDSLRAEALYSKTRTFFNKAQYDSSAYFAEKASEVYASLGDWEKYLFCRNTLGYCMTYSRDLKGAAEVFKKNIEIGSEKLDGTSSEYIITYTHLSHALKKMGFLDSAYYYSENAVKLAEKNPEMDSTIFARTYLGAANVQVAKFYLDEAKATILKGLRIKKHQQDSIDSYTQELHNTLAIVHFYKNNFGRAIKHYRKALEIATDLTPDNLSYPARYLSNIGLCYMVNRNLDSASYLFEKSLQLRIELFGSESLQASRIYENLGYVNHERGALEKALSYYQKALNVYQKNLQKNHPRIASTLASLSFIYRDQKDYDQAVTYLRKSIELTDLNFGRVDRLAATYKDLGYTLMLADRPEESKREFNEALQIILSQESVDSITLADTQTYIAQLESKQGRKAPAYWLLNKNLQIYENKFGRKNFNVADTYIEIGNLKMETGDLDSALLFFQKGLQSIAVDFEEEDIHKNPDLDENILNESTLLLALKAKATALYRKYERNEDLELLTSCISTCELAVRLVEQIRNSFIDEESKLDVLQNAKGLHELGVLAGFKLYEVHNDRSLLDRTFVLAEKNKSSILRNTIFESKARSFSDIPDSLLERETDLKAEISFLDSELSQKENRRKTTHLAIEELENKSFHLKREHEHLIGRFEQEFPKYFELKYNNELASTQEIQSLLAKDNNLVEYHLGDSAIFIWILNSQGLSIVQVPVDRRSLTTSVQDFKKAVVDQRIENYIAQSGKLYDWLVRPVTEYLVGDRIIFVPDDQLWEVNFELLLEKKPPSIDYRDFDYLLKKYAISYAYSANLLVSQAIGKPLKETRNEVLAFSYSNTDRAGNNVALEVLRDSRLEDLPGSRNEILQISEIFDGNYFFGQEANEATFKALADRYAILHLALHGQSNTDHPNSSNLIFTSESDSLEDGHLYAYELYNLSLPADLAVLSACNTGIGQLISGEGMMTLGRAFTYAGCKSLVYTQWEIPDTSAPVLMSHFYRGLNEGKTKDVALRDAKLAFLTQSGPAQASPLFWGGFVLQGVTEPLDKTDLPYGLILISIAILILGAVGYKWRT